MTGLSRRPLVLVCLAALVCATLPVGLASAAPGPRPDPGAATPASAAAAGKSDTDGDKISDELEAALQTLAPGERVPVIVQGATPGQARQGTPSLTVDRQYTIIPAFAGSVVAGQVTALAAIPWVTRVELDGRSSIADAAGDRDYGVQAARDVVPSLAADGTLDGDGVGICVIDTGVDPDHEQLSGRVIGWKDFVNARSTPYDDHGHGTHVASIAAGDATGSAAAAVYGGVARAAGIVSAKVLDSSGSGPDSGVAAAIDWCAQRGDVQVISMSLGSTGGDGSDAISQAVDSAVGNYGKVAVVAAGNGGDAPRTISSPGVATRAITVGAATDYSTPASLAGQDAGLVLAAFSSRGPTSNPSAPLKPDVVAPGVTVVAAQAGTTSGYVTYTGTSMATPFVAGVVALGLDAVPGASPDQVKTALQSSALDAGVAGPDNDWGYGLVDARAFLDALRGTAPAQHTAWPVHQVVAGSVVTRGTTDLPFTVTAAGQPLGVTLRIDGAAACSASFLGFCLAYEWSPDLDAYLLDPTGTQVAMTRCPLEATNGNCVPMGRQESMGVVSAAAGTWTVRVVPFADAPNNGKGGTFAVDAFGALGTGAPGNRAPTAAAGADVSSPVGTAVTFNGSGSSDPLGYTWTVQSRPSGSTASLVGAGTATPSFTPDVAGPYTMRLTVSDGRGGTGSDDLVLTATAANRPPVANAGPDVTYRLSGKKATFTLDGSASYDPDTGQVLTYRWTLASKVVGTTATLSQTKGVGTYPYTLRVSDPLGATAADTVTITVQR